MLEQVTSCNPEKQSIGNKSITLLSLNEKQQSSPGFELYLSHFKIEYNLISFISSVYLIFLPVKYLESMEEFP